MSADNYTSTVDFESAATTYSDWTFGNLNFQQSAVTAHGGNYYAATNGSSSAYAKTNNVIANPVSMVFYYTKSSDNTNSGSKFKIQVSTNGSTWTDVAVGLGMNQVTKGTWYELSADLSEYQDVYVRAYYDGTSAVRCIDDITLTYTSSSTPTCSTPTFSPAAGTYSSAQNVSIACTTEGAAIYYTTDGSTPTAESTAYTQAIPVSTTTTIKAIAVADGYTNSAVATATYTIVPPYEGEDFVRITSLDDLSDSDKVIIAARYDNTATAYYAMTAAATGKPTGVAFTSDTSSNGEVLPASILNNIGTYRWTVGVTSDGYTFTNDDGQALGYSSSTNFATGGNNTEWVIVRNTSGGSAMVSAYEGFYITNKNNTGRGIALNKSYSYGPYATSNNNSSDYNFYLDIFVEGSSSVVVPAISTENVSLAYDAVSGSIAYTINNEPDPAGTMTASTTSDWLTISNGTNFTCSANTAATERAAIVTLTYTYGDNETVTKDVTVTQAGNPNVVMTIAEVRAQGTGDVETKGVVTSCVGTTGYIQDETAAICVYGEALTVGDEIRVSGTLSTYKGLLEITEPVFTVLSQDNTVNPQVMTIAQVLESDKQGWLVRIENATVTAINSSSTTIAQVESTIGVHGISSDVVYGVDDIISLTGNIGCFVNTQIANPTNVQVQEAPNAVSYYITGSFNSWSTDTNNMRKLTKNNDGKYDADITFDGTTTFKVIRKEPNSDPTWLGAQADGNFVINRNSGSINLVDGSNFQITAGEYTFTVEEHGDNNPATLTVTGWPAPKYYIEGSWTQDWDEGMVELTDNTDGTFGCTMEVGDGTRFKFVKSEDNVLTRYGANQSDDYYVHSEWCTDIAVFDYGQAPFRIQTSGSCTLTFTLNVTDMTFSVTGWPVILEGDKFVKVTSTNELTNGKYLIVYEEGSLAFNGGLETLDAVGNTIGVTIADNEIAATTETEAAEFTIDVNAGTIKSASGQYIGRDSDTNGLETSTEPYTNTISIDANGNADVVSEGGAYLRYNATSGQTRFRYFKSSTYISQKAIQLYKLLLPEATFSENDTEATTITANDNKLVNATLERTLSNTYWSTFSVPFNVDAAQVTAVLGENVGLRKFQGSEGTVIKFQEATTIEAGHAYLVKPAETVTNPVFNGVTVVNTTGIADSDDRGYGFVGAVIKKTLKTIDQTTDQMELFLGTDAKFYYPASADVATMKGLRGYFVVPAGTETSKLSVDVEGSGIATSINSMNIEGMGDGNIYNLNGQRVNAPQKGLYIVNGKKVIIK